MAPFLTFINTHRAWYAEALGDLADRRELMFSVRENDEHGLFLYEFAIREYDHSNPGSRYANLALRVEVFHDAWSAFTDFPDLFAFLRNNSELSFDELVAHMGVTYYDATEYVRA